MAISDIRTTMRLRTGDNKSSQFLSDSQWEEEIKAAGRKLKFYSLKEGEVEITGDGGQVYDIPAEAQNVHWYKVYLRSGDDATTDTPLYNMRKFANKLYLDSRVSSTDKIIVWTKGAYNIDEDTLSDDVSEILYMLCEIEFINHAMHRRGDFQHWAITSRADTSINQLILLRSALKDQLSEYAQELADGMEAEDLWRYE